MNAAGGRCLRGVRMTNTKGCIWLPRGSVPRICLHSPLGFGAYNHLMISVRQLTKRFTLPGGGSLVAVNRLSFAVQPGEVYGLLGPNGAGKTTTLRMLLGLLQPTSGEASIAGFGTSQHPDEVKRRVG